MPKTFSENGIEFHYPDNWVPDQDEIDHGWVVTVQSPSTAFVLVCLRNDEIAPDDLASEALDELREEYDNVEADEVTSTLCRQPAVGYDARFFSFDLTNTCRIRAAQTQHGSLLVMSQMTDLDEEIYEPVMAAIVASLQIHPA
jgi:hypothetical protein